MYKVDGISDLAQRFRFKAEGDEIIAEGWDKSGVLLHTIEIDGRLKVMIEVSEDVRAVQLRKVIPYALKLRDKLMEFQGAWSMGGNNEFFERLCYLQERGTTYTEIAELLKSRVEKHLRAAVAFDDEYRKALPTLKSYGDYFMWAFGSDGMHNKYNPYSFEFAEAILELMGMDDKNITEWLKEGVENIRAGKKPFPQNPITRQDVIETLRTWRRGKKHKSIRARCQREEQEAES